MAWNRSSGNGEAASSPLQGKGAAFAMKRRGRRVPVYIACAIVVLGAAVAVWWLWPETNPPPSTSATTSISLIREVNPIVTSKATVAQEGPAVRMHMGSKVVRTETITNHSGIVMERLYTEDGKRHRVYHYPPPVFRHPSDNYLAMILSTPPGAVMPPLPDLSHDKNLETQFRESLKDEIVIGEGDSEEVKEIKERVILARESMKQLLDQGRKFAEVIEEERRIFNENHDLRAMVVKEYADLVRGDTIDNAENYRLAMNKKLAEMGIEEVPLKVKKDNRKPEQKGR